MSHITLIPSAYYSAWHIIQGMQFLVKNRSSNISHFKFNQRPEHEQVVRSLWVCLWRMWSCLRRSLAVGLTELGVISAFPANCPMTWLLSRLWLMKRSKHGWTTPSGTCGPWQTSSSQPSSAQWTKSRECYQLWPQKEPSIRVLLLHDPSHEFCLSHSYGMRFIAKVLKDSLHEKFPDAGEDELLKVRIGSWYTLALPVALWRKSKETRPDHGLLVSS